MAKFDWTPERVEALTRLWTDGHTAAHIAARLGCSRGSVLGKLFRLQAEGRCVVRTKLRRQNTSSAQLAAARSCQEKAGYSKDPALPKLKGTALPCTHDLVDLENHQCRYAGAELNGRHLFCGQDRIPGSPYCEAHHAVCYVTVPAKVAEKDLEVA